MSTKMCRCGCGSEAVFKFSGVEFNPKAKDKKGEAFVEYACHAATRYMIESSAELGFPYEVEKVQ